MLIFCRNNLRFSSQSEAVRSTAEKGPSAKNLVRAEKVTFSGFRSFRSSAQLRFGLDFGLGQISGRSGLQADSGSGPKSDIFGGFGDFGS